MLEAEKVVVCCQSKIDPPQRSEKARGDTRGFWEDAVCFTKISFRLFFPPQRNTRDVESSTEAARRGWDADGGRGWGWGEQGERAEEGPCLSLGWLVFYLYPLRVPEIINMCCHSCFPSGDFIQSLQKFRIKSHGFVFWRATLPHTGEFCILWRHVRPATFAEH